MAVIHKFLYLATLISVFLMSSVVSREDENAKEDKKSRLYSCLRLANIMIQEDKDYLPMVNKELITSFKTKSFDELFEELKDKVLLTCYTEISAIKAAELISSKTKAINPFTKENKALLNPETFKATFYESGNLNTKTYNKHLEKMKELYNLLLEDILAFEEKIATFLDFICYDSQKVDSLYRKKSKRPYTTRTEDRKRNEEEGEKESSRSSLNLNLFGYDLTDPKIKNSLGFILLAIIFVGIFFSYKIIMKKGSEASDLPRKSKKDRSKSK